MNDSLEPISVTVKPPEPVNNEIDIGEVKPEVAKAAPEPAKNAAEDGIELLKRQLEDKRREAEEAQRAKAEAERRALLREREIEQYETRAQSSEHTALVNAIASFERDAEMLEKDYATFLEQGDYQKAAKVQRQMAAVESRLTTLQQGREELEYRLTNPPKREDMPVIQPVARDPFEERISTLSQPSQQWLRQNRQVLDDPRLTNKMTAAHYEALADSIRADSPEYFQFIESKLGLNGQEPVMSQPSRQAPTSSGRVAMAAAPVSRSAPANIRNSDGSVSITLTPEQRAYARDLDMTDEEYAANLLYYKEQGRIGG
jgi:hypothetical protein